MKSLQFLTGLMMVSVIFISSCSKKAQEPISQATIFGLQAQSFSHIDNNILTVIRFSYISGDLKSIINTIPVTIYTCDIGGVAGFSSDTVQNNFYYQIDTNITSASFPDGQMVIDGQAATIQQSHSYTGFPTINSVSYNGQVYSAYSFDIAYGMATYGKIACWYNQLIKEGQNCTFNAYVNGIKDAVNWTISNNIITIKTSKLLISGEIQNHTFATPTIVASDGAKYIICFYNLDGTNSAQCNCTESFKIYQINTENQSSASDDKIASSNTFQLIISRN